ncbi:MAG TPA: Clp protease N-terminal domain-containing protein, partial [Vicinamibacteria bacterium]|nr:Clp protease N-terminal domain-containing protein [Vicinamibacteria bacterium]
MFSRTVERVLNAAAREAVSRRHSHLTLEHLLFAVLGEPDGEKILRASGADTARLRQELGTFLEESLEVLPIGSRRAPEQTLAFRRVLQTAVLHVQSAGKTEADIGDVLAALMAQSRSYAVDLLAAQGVTRLDILNYISHGLAKHR